MIDFERSFQTGIPYMLTKTLFTFDALGTQVHFAKAKKDPLVHLSREDRWLENLTVKPIVRNSVISLGISH